MRAPAVHTGCISSETLGASVETRRWHRRTKLERRLDAPVGATGAASHIRLPASVAISNAPS